MSFVIGANDSEPPCVNEFLLILVTPSNSSPLKQPETPSVNQELFPDLPVGRQPPLINLDRCLFRLFTDEPFIGLGQVWVPVGQILLEGLLQGSRLAFGDS